MRLIDADALFAEYENVDWYNNADRDEIAERLVLQAPTIDAVSVVHGEWLPFEYGDDTWHKCSVCGIADKYKGSMPRPNGTIAEWEYVRNYCPNCGAKMKGADDE